MFYCCWVFSFNEICPASYHQVLLLTSLGLNDRYIVVEEKKTVLVPLICLFIDDQYYNSDIYTYVLRLINILGCSLPPSFLFFSLYPTFDLFASLFVFVIWRDVNLATPRESILTSDTKKNNGKKKI